MSQTAAQIRPGPEPRREFLAFHRPDIDEDDISAVTDAMRAGWLTHGPLCREFEMRFAEKVGAARAVSVSSGTAAMHLSLAALGIGRGDEVITTPFTFCATAHVIEHVGARPVFVDIDPVSMQIDPRGVEHAVTPLTKAIIPVHYGGQACDIESILEIAERHGIAVVEDAAHALGALVGSRHIGSFGTTTCFSFYATKNITTGEGGMVTTDDASLADRLESLRLHGISRDAWRRYGKGGSWSYEVQEPGFKANLTDFQAALGLSQLAKETRMRLLRTKIAYRYNESFSELGDLLEIPLERSGTTSAWHLFPLRLRLENLRIDRDGFIEELGAYNVGTSVHFIPLHLQPHFRDAYGFAPGDFPSTEATFERIVSLPIYPSMTDEDIAYVVDCVTSIAALHAG
jgi:dTDP-4-amino-4,6-dideoxygalactose transaminase